ncbi:MAG: Alanine-tRNA ligase [Candidatus Nomurabacteria bacterium GW2011_GWA2_40_9]|uniref:alanine--tRNA ligase n=1 Tax=Candidatus Nomurabacteria bacterium GW2011_GWA2_40_9 TaxID=1618734 RepID=A0A0G0WTC5_9BACT|nr:MAG: Alanine-tRNA ligase [Candidatus Nomurabacteria bacterium GW2011_GWA2_40_9]
MESNEIRNKFLKFFESRGHKIIPSASLVPEGDISVLFTTAGMQQFKEYYSAPLNAIRDFGAKNVVTVQKCIRTGDIDEVGDATHLSFFEMLGNFSFGGYGRQEAITYAYEFITHELGLTISFVTIYKGEGIVPKDEESRNIWKDIDSNLDIREDGADVFWGPTGNSGPCGPTTEIYCKNANGEDVEIWNIVFNEYFCDGSREKLDKGEAKLSKLETLGIDTGMGFERLLAIAEGKKNVYDTDVFNSENTREDRIIADHIKASLFIISDGVIPGNTGRGYVLRRLIRRAVRFSKEPLANKIETIKNLYKGIYNLDDEKEIEKEEKKFRETLEHGMKEFEKGHDAFTLFTTYGFPLELTLELAKEKGIEIDVEDFNKKIAEHQKLSQTASVGMFKGGLANHNEQTIRLHTAHHLLLAALQTIINKDIKQRGSNITEERLRMDFLCDHKLTDEEKKKVEDWVNEKIKLGLNVVRREMPLIEAQKLGAEMEFGAKYPDVVSVYFIGDSPKSDLGANAKEKKSLSPTSGNHVSIEFCGGPHVKNTRELSEFKIQKEEAVAAGIRRIKAVLV